MHGTRYDKIADAFGAKGYSAETIPEMNQVLAAAFQENTLVPVLVNVVVDPTSSRKAQVPISVGNFVKLSLILLVLH